MRFLYFVAVCCLLPLASSEPSLGQVTTATFYGIVTDPTGGLVPGATVTLIHEGTNAAVARTSDAAGEFAFDFLRVGSYTLRIEARGFKRHESKGIDLVAAQTVRQTFALEVGAITETVTVEGAAPLVSTASSEQLETFKLAEMPLGRRNVSGILRLTTGVDMGAGRSPRLNGIGANGTGISVDGTDANSNPEQRGMAQYGAFNYIDVMSVDAIQEVQLVRGILAAEYGGVVGGQVNILSKSGGNAFHGAVFENYDSHVLNARNPFIAARTADGRTIPKPRVVFNQFGGSMGGPVIRDRVFFFGTYEGYRESSTVRANITTPYPAYRTEILRALPFQETRILLDILPLPNVRINDDIGRFETIRNANRHENHVVAKGDFRLTPLSNLALAYTRMRPYGLEPRAYVDGANDRTYEYKQDRATVTFTTGGATWTSESRFGHNVNDMKRLDLFFLRKDPSGATEKTFWGRSVPRISVAGPSGFGSGSAEIWDMDGNTYSFDQKVARHLGRHSLKFGGRYARVGGFRSNPENPSISFQSKADLLANIPRDFNFTFGSPPYKSRMHEIGLFLQDDWRVTPKLVLNLGLRYDFYSKNISEPTSEVPVGMFNLAPPSDWSKFDFGPARDPKDPYKSDGWVNLGPRFGFAYNPDGQAKTVVRGGFGVLFSPQMPAVVRQAVAHPVVPFRIVFSAVEGRELGQRFPDYTDRARELAERQVARGGFRFPFSAINPGLQNPYAMHYQFNIQRALTTSLMLETGYVGNRGVKFIMHRRPNLPDRLTGIRPNPTTIFGGYYVDNTQNTLYNAWQTSLRKRFSRNLAFDVHHTWGKVLATQGADIGAYYGSDNDSYFIQEFDNPLADRGLAPGDAKHRFLADFVYDLPRFSDLGNPFVRHVLRGWQVTGVFSTRSGERVTVTQSCAAPWHCRPDYLGGQTVHQNWEQNATTRCVPGGRCSIQYIDRDAYALVPVNSQSRVTARPGSVGVGAIRNPATWGLDIGLGKNIKFSERFNLQLRADMFNFLNHVNYGGPSANRSDATFGEINGAGGMRTIQLNARLSW